MNFSSQQCFSIYSDLFYCSQQRGAHLEREP
nr:MAG TPA: hypothetical protein [Caudoviricetes sp.]